jgi:outer membrane receptor protein involved in Fe transport
MNRSNIYTNKGFYEEQELVSSEIINEESYLYNSRYELYYQFLEGTINYEHAFTKDKSHLLSAYLTYTSGLRPLTENKIDNKEYDNYTEQTGYFGAENDEVYLEGKVAYENKISKNLSLEFGSEMTLDNIPEVTSISGKIENETYVPIPNEPEEQTVEFKQNIYAGYLSLKSSFKQLECMFGFRAEYTDRYSNYEYSYNGENVQILAVKKFIDFFPSVHTVYNFTDEQQLALSYSRRINRPDYWSLIPITRYESPYSYYSGNGDLIPAYASSFELNYLYSWKKNYFSTEIFARKVKDVIQNYYSASNGDYILYRKENVGDSWSIGTELMTDIDILKWWTTNFSTSMFWYKINVDIETEDRVQKKFRTNSHINNTFKISNTLTFKLDINYRSPNISAQLEQEAYWYSDLSLRKTFANKKWQVQLASTNVFNTLKYHTITEGDDFYVDSYFEKDPFVSLKITYLIDNQD